MRPSRRSCDADKDLTLLVRGQCEDSAVTLGGVEFTRDQLAYACSAIDAGATHLNR